MFFKFLICKLKIIVYASRALAVILYIYISPYIFYISIIYLSFIILYISHFISLCFHLFFFYTIKFNSDDFRHASFLIVQIGKMKQRGNAYNDCYGKTHGLEISKHSLLSWSLTS